MPESRDLDPALKATPNRKSQSWPLRESSPHGPRAKRTARARSDGSAANLNSLARFLSGHTEVVREASAIYPLFAATFGDERVSVRDCSRYSSGCGGAKACFRSLFEPLVLVFL